MARVRFMPLAQRAKALKTLARLPPMREPDTQHTPMMQHYSRVT